MNRQFQGDWSLWWFWQLCFCSVWGRCPAERGEQTQRCAQLSAQLSARLCSLDWSCFHTTLRCTESIHFLWSLHRKFSGLLVRPWISSAVADGKPGFLNLCLHVCSPSQVLGDVYTEVLEAAHPLHRGPTDHKSHNWTLIMSNLTHPLWWWRNLDMKWADNITFTKFKGL